MLARELELHLGIRELGADLAKLGLASATMSPPLSSTSTVGKACAGTTVAVMVLAAPSQPAASKHSGDERNDQRTHALGSTSNGTRRKGAPSMTKLTPGARAN